MWKQIERTEATERKKAVAQWGTEKHRQLTSKTTDINILCNVLIEDFITVAIPCLNSSDSDSDMSL